MKRKGAGISLGWQSGVEGAQGDRIMEAFQECQSEARLWKNVKEFSLKKRN